MFVLCLSCSRQLTQPSLQAAAPHTSENIVPHGSGPCLTHRKPPCAKSAIDLPAISSASGGISANGRAVPASAGTLLQSADAWRQSAQDQQGAALAMEHSSGQQLIQPPGCFADSEVLQTLLLFFLEQICSPTCVVLDCR